MRSLNSVQVRNADGDPATAMASGRIIFVSHHDPHDISKWSGTVYSLFQALNDNRSGFEVRFISGAYGGMLDLAARAVNLLCQKAGLSLDARFSAAYAVAAGVFLTIKLYFMKGDTIVAVAASNYLAYVRTRKRIIYVSDGTFRAISQLYPAFKSFPKWLRDQGHRNEARSLAKANYVLLPSRWALNSAIEDYGVPREKLFELPFGPNIDRHLIDTLYVPKAICSTDEIVVLFVSADWRRKNGEIAIEMCRVLQDSGIKIRLVAIGDAPKDVDRQDFVENKGFLRKADPSQLRAICEAYRQAHFLVLPTMADASPIVFCEAQAFGLPPVAYDVGGTSSAIADRFTGLLLPIGSDARDFADRILEYIKDPNSYAQLSARCRRRHLEEANWANWSSLIFRLAKGPDSGPASSMALGAHLPQEARRIADGMTQGAPEI